MRRHKECKVSSSSDSYIECVGVGLSYKLAFLKAKLCCIRKKRREKLEAARLVAI